jgi:tryptophan-rich sensory protein
VGDIVRPLIGLIVFLSLTLAVSLLGGLVTATSVDTWYQGLAKPVFNPPDWVFAPVWSTLFLLMAVAAWRVWRLGGVKVRSRELAAFAFQLALNLGWSVLFFGFKAPGWALIEMLALFAAILWTMWVFWRCDRWAGALLVPYAAWVGFALVLNGAIWHLN